ncbi:MAG: hypothetical protein A2W22_01450 [Candidatus Levybacteria bacterium RBG_16_35_11]|nr:MAG: hypothetical protein A2W22_01450 [Candidatus Levybacteria bacterium RBG_16_35_11]
MVEGIKDQQATSTEPKKEKEDSFRWTRDPKKPILRIENGVCVEEIMAVRIAPYGTPGKFEYPEGPILIDFGQDVKKLLKKQPTKLSGWVVRTVHEADKHFEDKDDEYHYCTIFTDDLGKETGEKKRQAKQEQKARKEAGKGWKMEQAGQQRLAKQRNIARRRPRWVPGYSDIPPEFGEPENELAGNVESKHHEQLVETGSKHELVRSKHKSIADIKTERLKKGKEGPFIVLTIFTSVQLYSKHPMQKEERLRTGKDNRPELESDQTHDKTDLIIEGTSKHFWREWEDHYAEVEAVNAENPDDEGLSGFVSKAVVKKALQNPEVDQTSF